MFANIGYKKQRHMRVSSSCIDYSSKIKPPIPSHLTQLVRPSILRNNITFYVHIFKMQMPCIPYEGQTWCKVVNIMWILYALIYLLIILLFEIIYPSKCQNNWFPATDAPKRHLGFPCFKTQDGQIYLLGLSTSPYR